MVPGTLVASLDETCRAALKAAKGEALELPKNWELRKVTLASGEEQVQLYRRNPGLMLILW